MSISYDAVILTENYKKEINMLKKKINKLETAIKEAKDSIEFSYSVLMDLTCRSSFDEDLKNDVLKTLEYGEGQIGKAVSEKD